MMKRSKLPGTAKKSSVAMHTHPSGATAFHVETPDGSHVVAYDNLRVLITKDDGTWIAQGLEIDYAIDGDSVAEVKDRFQTGLAMTIESHMRVYNDIINLLRPAPAEVWQEYFAAKNTLRRFKASQVMVRQLQAHLPFDKIIWVESDDAAA